MFNEADHCRQCDAARVCAPRMKAEACSRFGAKVAENNSATGEISLNGAAFGRLRLAPDRKRSRCVVGAACGANGPQRFGQARRMAGATPLDEPELSQFSEHIVTIAAAPTGGEHEATVAITQRKTAPAVQRASAAPSAALTPGVAERASDVGGVHDPLSEAVEWSRPMGETASRSRL